MPRALFVATLLAAATTARAQPAPTVDGPLELVVTGVVRDAASGAAIAGARLELDGVAAGTTGADGAFALTAAPGAALFVDADGYQAALVGATADPLVIELLAIEDVGEVIELTEAPPTAVAGAVSLTRDELATLPGAGGDLLSTLTVLPGVTTQPGRSGRNGSGVIIRGSSPEDSRILLDGFDIPQLYHSVLGRSIIPTAAVAGLDYLPGGFDVRYGRATSGIVAVRSRGAEPHLTGEAELSSVDGTVVGGGPVGRHGRVLVSMRRSWVDAWLPYVIPDDVAVELIAAPRFYDGLVRYDVDLGERWNAAVTVIGSDDRLEVLGEETQSDEVDRFSANTGFVRAIAATQWRSTDGLTLDAGVSTLIQQLGFERDADEFYQNQTLSLGARAELTQRRPELAGLSDVVLRAGAELDPRRLRLSLALDRQRDEGDVPDGRGDDVVLFFEDTLWLTDVGAWAAIEAGLAPDLRMTAGLRVDGYLDAGAYPLHPRGELTWQADDATRVRLAAGRYTRGPETREELITPGLGPESASQVTLGVERKLGASASVQLTGYDTQRTDLITRDDDGVLRNQGRGHTLGVEVAASLRTPRWFGWLSYSRSTSTRRDTPMEPSRLFDYDQPHDLVVAGTFTPRGDRWQFGAKFTYASMLPLTPILGGIFDSDRDRYYPVPGPTNSERPPAHHQLDVRVDHTWTFQRWKLSAFLDIQNVYVNQSVIRYTYRFDYGERAAITAIPIVPAIGLRGEL
ncbi:MAG: TonB-dependent receptor [Kofleriaceae bacterium]